MTQYGIAIVDLLFIAVLIAGFIAGFIQGVVRRLLGIAATMIAFILAANLRVPAGEILAENWTQYTAEYVTMLAFGGLFIVLFIFFSVLIQGFYRRAPVIEDKEWVDEILGGVLGVVEVSLILGIGAVVLASYFGAPGFHYDPSEYPWLRTIYTDVTLSAVGRFAIDTLIPVFIASTGPLIPDSLRVLLVL